MQINQPFLPLQFLLPSTDLLWNSQKTYPYILPERIASKVSSISHTTIFVLNTISQLVKTSCSLAKSGASASMGVSRNALIRAFTTAENIQKTKYTQNERKENEKFINSISNCTNFGIKTVNYAFSCAEMMTYASVHLTEKTLLYSLSWMEQFFLFIDKVFGDTDVSHDITTFISIFIDDICYFIDNEKGITEKFFGLIKLIKAISIYICLLVVVKEKIKKSRKNKLIYNGLIEIEKGYIENLIQEEENEALMQYLEDEVLPEYESSLQNINVNKNNNKNNEKEIWENVKLSFQKNYSFPDYILMYNKNASNSNNIASNKNNNIQNNDNNSNKKENNGTNLYPTINNENLRRRSSLRGKDDKLYCNDLEEIIEQSMYENESIMEMINSFEYNKSSYIYQLYKSQSAEDLNKLDKLQEQKKRIKDLVYYVKFACGAYGKYNTKIIYNSKNENDDNISIPEEKLIRRLHPNDYSFSIHTKIPLKCILSSSYHYSSVKDTPNSDAAKLDYVIAVDHLTNSVVLTICGAIGLSDLLSNLSYEYEKYKLNKKYHYVHKSIYQSAMNFAEASSIPLTVISKALEVHSTYRLILCGHSYGGAVAALLGLIWSNPERPNVTNDTSGIPANRLLHVYVYGAPSCMSYSLSKHCRSFITSIVNYNDIIPYLSYGFLNDQRQCINFLYNNIIQKESPSKKSETKSRCCVDRLLSKTVNKSKASSSSNTTTNENNNDEDIEIDNNVEWINEVFSRSFNTLGKRSDTKIQQDDLWFNEKYGKCKDVMSSKKIYPPGFLFIMDVSDEKYQNPNILNTKISVVENEEDMILSDNLELYNSEEESGTSSSNNNSENNTNNNSEQISVILNKDQSESMDIFINNSEVDQSTLLNKISNEDLTQTSIINNNNNNNNIKNDDNINEYHINENNEINPNNYCESINNEIINDWNFNENNDEMEMEKSFLIHTNEKTDNNDNNNNFLLSHSELNKDNKEQNPKVTEKEFSINMFDEEKKQNKDINEDIPSHKSIDNDNNNDNNSDNDNDKKDKDNENDSETISRIKLYECQDMKKHFSDIVLSKNMFSYNKPNSYEELVIALGKIVFGYSLY